MDWSQADLARAAGCSRAAVTNYMTGFSKNMEPRFAFRLQDKFQWNARWLLEGVGPARVKVLPRDEEEAIEALREMHPEERQAFTRLILRRT